MNNDDIPDTGRFTLHPEEENVPEPAPPAIDPQTQGLKRLNSRITRVMLLLPCLFAAILAVAYLDLKKRMESGHSSGTFNIQRLSDDLAAMVERQTALDTQLAEQSKAWETASANMQTRMKTAVDDVRRITAKKTDQAALDAAVKQMEAQLTELRKEMEDLDVVVTQFDKNLSAQLLQIVDGITKNRETIVSLQKQTQTLAAGQINKEALDLAIRLERINVQELIKAQTQNLSKKLSALESAHATLKQQVSARGTTSVPTPVRTIYTPPKPVTPPTSEKSGSITEMQLN
ncbi:hypothetical protein LJC71_03875 [Desulfosarcina sp. OttesenSCG-928-A07]|nr:hypothetical protein [Desulfosarcina sp. OttesenSCG-928-G17]MDL2328876.1 hypothetical protein [Desulfosarcina sp. OttesenSCG-928-A07]